MSAILEASALTKVYRLGEVRVEALRGVDLALERGELAVFLGPSGSGKSTLLHLLGGLDLPSSGRLRFGELDLTAADDDARTRYRRESVGFVFQFYNLVPTLTARENVALVTDLSAHPIPAEEALFLVGLGDRRDRLPSQLSGGEQQRVAIARAVAKRPALLLCDEPTGALDAATGRAVLEVIDRINRELGTTTALVTHNTALAALADRVFHFRDGRIVEIRSNPARSTAGSLSW